MGILSAAYARIRNVAANGATGDSKSGKCDCGFNLSQEIEWEKEKCDLLQSGGLCLAFGVQCEEAVDPKICAAVRKTFKIGVTAGIKARGIGHWIIGTTPVSGIKTSTCSQCGKESTGKIGGEIKHIYMGDATACPMCGALMLEEKRNENT